MGIVTEGYGGSTSGATTPGSAAKSTASTASNNPLSAVTPDLNSILSGSGVVAPKTLPASDGTNAGVVNQLIGGAAFTTEANNAQNLALQQQSQLEQGQYALTGQQAQQSAGQTLQGLGLSGQALTLQQQELGQESALNPQEQAIEAGQYGLGQQSAAIGQTAEEKEYGIGQEQVNQQIANTQQLYNQSLPGQYSGEIASGAGNSGAAQLANTQGAQQEQYNVGQQQESQQAQQLGQSAEVKQYGLGQESQQLGQVGEIKNYQYTQKQLADQEKNLAIAGKQLGLSKAETETQLKQALQTAGIGGQEVASQIASQEAGNNANTIANIIQSAGLGSLAQTPATPAKPATTKKVKVK